MPKFDRNRIKDGWEKLCTNKQTDRHYENTGHLAVNQHLACIGFGSPGPGASVSTPRRRSEASPVNLPTPPSQTCTYRMIVQRRDPSRCISAHFLHFVLRKFRTFDMPDVGIAKVNRPEKPNFHVCIIKKGDITLAIVQHAADRLSIRDSLYFLVHVDQATIIFVVSVGLSVRLFVQSFSQPSLIRFQSNLDICYMSGSSCVP